MNNIIQSRQISYAPAFRQNPLNNNKFRTFMNNQTEHIITQTSAWLALSAIHPSENAIHVILKKICIDLGEAMGNKTIKGEEMEISRRAFNLFSYINWLKKNLF